jgi:glycosyltransferase involved in cell wall biosynthesis
MIYLVIILFIMVGYQLLVALQNYIFRTRYNRYHAKSADKMVSVIVPARNESGNIGNLLNDLSRQQYKNLEIIVVDDDSTDNTAEIVIRKSFEDPRIQLIRTSLRDKSWLGKNFACYTGASTAEGHYYLFLDADVRLEPEAIRHIIAYFRKSKVAFLSVFPKQIMDKRELYQIVPLMNYILLSLLPLYMVRFLPFASMAAANGQFMLFSAGKYRKYLPHEKFRREKVEDIHIARYLKRKKERIACLTGMDDISCRMYESKAEAIRGFSKNVVEFFGNSWVLAVIFWFINITAVVWIMFYSFRLAILYLVLVAIIRTLISLTSRQRIGLNILYHFHQMYNLGVLIIESAGRKINKTYEWKGRNIS